MEHSGFTFQSDPTEAAKMVRLHSGGKISDALSLAYSSGSLELPKAVPNVKDSSLSEAIGAVDLLPIPKRDGHCLCCFGFGPQAKED